MNPPRGLRLTAQTFATGIDVLTGQDPDLAAICRRFGRPAFRARPPGFATLLRIILEQQVSLASARAVFDKLAVFAPELKPGSFLDIDPCELRRIGFSRQKQSYCRVLAESVKHGEIDLIALGRCADDTVRARLCAIKGVGPWTAEVYLLTALRRADAWPRQDLALIVALQKVKRLRQRPMPQLMAALAEPWRPWRGVAARLLWHDYLQGAAPP
jgi:DNA-3-methyladenine glycosylase II